MSQTAAPPHDRRTLAYLTALFATSHGDRHILAIALPATGLDLGLNDIQLGVLSGLGRRRDAVDATPSARPLEQRIVEMLAQAAQPARDGWLTPILHAAPRPTRCASSRSRRRPR